MEFVCNLFTIYIICAYVSIANKVVEIFSLKTTGIPRPTSQQETEFPVAGVAAGGAVIAVFKSSTDLLNDTKNVTAS